MTERDTADYEESEGIAIASGKSAIERAPWLHDRTLEKSRGFFYELKENNVVHPGWFAVHTVDGVGTKLFFTPWSGNFRVQSIDGVAMCANDLAPALHAFPDAINLYFAMQTQVEEQHMGEIMHGFVEALERIRLPNSPFNVNIGKIETASLDEMISLGVPNKGWDVGVVISGYISKDKVPNLNPKPGNFIVGVSSTGMHSNGYTGARHVLLTPAVEYRDEWKGQYRGRFQLTDRPEILEGKSLVEALQVPTALYLLEAHMVGQEFDNRDVYGVNITGNGLHNFNRAGKGVSFEIEDSLEPLPIHRLLMDESGWDLETAYKKQNMGMGFAYVVPDRVMANEIVALINGRGENTAKVIGRVDRLRDGESDLRTTLHLSDGSLNFVGYSN